jgi:type VI secretion system secreted protein Hcp
VQAAPGSESGVLLLAQQRQDRPARRQFERKENRDMASTSGQTFDAYINVDGIPGEALDDKHKDWIEVLSFQHGMTQPTSSTRTSAGGGTTGRSTHDDFAIMKHLDKSSPKLYEALSTGKHFSKVSIELCRAGGSQVKFMEIKLEQVVISNISLSGNGSIGGNSTSSDHLPTESVSFNYGKITWTYTQQKRSDGSGGGNVTGAYDLMGGKGS